MTERLLAYTERRRRFMPSAKESEQQGGAGNLGFSEKKAPSGHLQIEKLRRGYCRTRSLDDEQAQDVPVVDVCRNALADHRLIAL